MDLPHLEEGRKPSRYPFMRALLIALFTAAVAIILLAGHSLYRSRAHHLAKAEIETSNLSSALAEDMTSTYDKIDLAVQAVKDEKERLLRSGTEDRAAMERFLERQHARVPALYSMRTTDASGTIDSGGSGIQVRPASVSDRDHFQRLKADPSLGLVISDPLIGKFTGKAVIIFARRISRPDGSFAGIVYGTLELEQLLRHFTSLTIGREGIISLRHTDPAMIIAGYGPKGPLVGHKNTSSDFQKIVGTSQATGTFTAPGHIDGIVRIHSFAKLRPYGHLIIVGIGTRDALAPWRRECIQTSTLALSFLVLIGASIYLANRAWRMQLQAEEKRRQTIQQLQVALEEVKALRGLLPICSYCKNVRDDKGYWSQIESYISSHSEAQFTHSVCPDCASKHFPELHQSQASEHTSPE